MGFSTTISVRSSDANRLMRHLANAGFLVLDTGRRITTDEGMDGEADLDLVWLGGAERN